MTQPTDVLIYDTTLRDGTQGERVNFSAEEKLRIAQKLDELGFHYIEGGWPGSNPKDMRFFDLAKRIPFKNTRLTAFGSTRRPNIRVEDCENIRTLLAAETPAVTIFGKSWDLHVTDVLVIPLEENLSMIRDSVAYLKANGKEVIYDAEHFFDGYKKNRDYALLSLVTAWKAGADFLVLCDTNGGTLPHELTEIVAHIRKILPEAPLGIHVHKKGLSLGNGKGSTQVDRRGRLADAALLICNTDYLGHGIFRIPLVRTCLDRVSGSDKQVW